MTPQPQQNDDDILLITRKEFVEMANVHTDGISPARIMDISIRVAERSRSAPLTENQKLSKEMREASELYRAGVKDGAAQAREKVLKEKQTLVALFFEKIQSRAYSNDSLPIVYLCDIESELELVIESLRNTGGDP